MSQHQSQERQECKGLSVLVVLLASFMFSPWATSALELAKPASFEGTLPCADCPGVDWHLDLWPDGRFHLQRSYQEREGSDDDLGRWRINPADNSLLLFGGREAPVRIAVLDTSTLRLLDAEGKAIASTLPYELQRLAAFAPTEIRQSMGGEFVYYADSARFEECRTGHIYPVTMEGDYSNAERRYLASRHDSADAEPLFLQIQGAIVNRQAMPSEGPPQSLLIERLVTDVPGLRCERAMSNASLPNTYWRLLRIDQRAITTSEGGREAHLLLQDSDGSVAGFGGCNRFRGSYTVNGEQLSFAPLASTMMACPEPAMTTEQLFTQALSDVASWKIAGQTLELLNKQGHSLLVFDAVYLP